MTDQPTPADSRAREELKPLSLDDIVRRYFHPGPIAGSTARLAAGLEEHGYRRVGTAPGSEGKEPVTLAECPVGLFRSVARATLGFKTEYGNNEGLIDAYIVESGEFFWGTSPQNIDNQRAQLVIPIASDVAEAALATVPPEPRAPSTSAVDEGAVRAFLTDCISAMGGGGPFWTGANDEEAVLDNIGVEARRLARLGQHQPGRGGEDDEQRVMREIALDGIDRRISGLEADVAFWKARAEERLGWYQEALACPTAPAAAQGDAAAESVREALEWYGEQARLCRLIHSEGDAGRHALSEDGGKRAKSALFAAPAPQAETPSVGEVGS